MIFEPNSLKPDSHGSKEDLENNLNEIKVHFSNSKIRIDLN